MEVTNHFNEYVTIKLQVKSKNVIVSVVYRSPNSDINNDNKLNQFITEICTIHSGDKLFLGDFNFPTINWQQWTAPDGDTRANEFILCLRREYLIQHIQLPTRIRGYITSQSYWKQ